MIYICFTQCFHVSFSQSGYVGLIYLCTVIAGKWNVIIHLEQCCLTCAAKYRRLGSIFRSVVDVLWYFTSVDGRTLDLDHSSHIGYGLHAPTEVRPSRIQYTSD